MVNRASKEYKEKQRKYAKEYRIKNKDKVRIANKKWVEANKEKKNEYQKKWYRLNHKEQLIKRRNWYARTNRKEKHKIYHKKLRLLILEKYGGYPPKCQCCNENKLEFLSIDHINGGGAQQRKSLKGTSFYRWLKMNNFPEGYRVLCMNCNWALGCFGYCPHQKDKK